jgi:hypothetical protein
MQYPLTFIHPHERSKLPLIGLCKCGESITRSHMWRDQWLDSDGISICKSGNWHRPKDS